MRQHQLGYYNTIIVLIVLSLLACKVELIIYVVLHMSMACGRALSILFSVVCAGVLSCYGDVSLL